VGDLQNSLNFNAERPNLMRFCLLQAQGHTPLEKPCKNGRSDSTSRILTLRKGQKRISVSVSK
jgi:hypothetical protein